MGHLAAILQRRSAVVHELSPDQTVQAAIEVMARHQVGVVPIVDGDRLVGIFSERDVVRRVLAKAKLPEKVALREVMTPEPVTAGPQESRESAVQKMQAVGCRHLPIVAQGTVIDMLSMRDLLFIEIEERVQEIEALRGYIHGSY